MLENRYLELTERKILFLCTGNSCRSQMAEGFAHQMGWRAFSAGTKPEKKVSPFTVKVMEEIDIDISHNIPESVNKYLDDNFDIVATVCDNVRATCPVFTGNMKQKVHRGFIDPADAAGSDSGTTKVYRKVRDGIQEWVVELTKVQVWE